MKHEIRHYASYVKGDPRSEDARIFKGVLQYGLFDRGEDESDIRGIGGLCETAAVRAYRLDGFHGFDLLGI